MRQPYTPRPQANLVAISQIILRQIGKIRGSEISKGIIFIEEKKELIINIVICIHYFS